MEFPITDLLSPAESTQWILDFFHPQGLHCPNCGEPAEHAYVHCQTKKSQPRPADAECGTGLTVYRCRACASVYNLYTGTIFQQRHFTPPQVVLLLRGILKGEPSLPLAAELKVSLHTILDVRRDLQESARLLQPNTPLTDSHTETDEMFQSMMATAIRM